MVDRGWLNGAVAWGGSKQGPGDRSGDQWGCLVVSGRRRLQGAVVDREMRKGVGKETLGDDGEGWGKFKDVPWNAGRALYIQQVGIALQGNSRHTATGGRYVIEESSPSLFTA